MTLASTKTSFLRKHGNPDLIHNVRFSHGVPLTMHVEVYDVVIAEETLPSYFDFPVAYSYVDKPQPVENGIAEKPSWFYELAKFDKGKAQLDLPERAKIIFTADDY